MEIRIPRLVFVLGATLVVAACGSSSSNMTNNAGGTGSTGSTAGFVSGTVVKGPVSGATVTAYAITNGTMGAQVGGGTTDALGNFNISVGTYSGPMMLQATGGTYIDEATGTTMTMQSGDVMAAAIPAMSAGGTMAGVQVTPLTSMAHDRVHHMTGGITAANINAANSWIGSYFGVSDILQVVPMNPLVSGSGSSASQDAKNYGMAMAAMSQYAKTIGMPNSSGMVTAFMSDASDGVLDGMVGTTAVQVGGGMAAGTTMQANAAGTGLANAMAAFIGSSMNKSGVAMTDMQSLMTKMSGSSGGAMGGGMTGGTMSGTGTKGPVSGATVTAWAIQDGMMGAQLGSTQTDATGHFTMSVGTYSGSVMLQMAGGSFMDEATGTTMPMMSGDVISACIPSMATNDTMAGLQLTPLTTMACARAKSMTDAMTAANLTTANTAVGSYFSVADIVTTMPMNPLTPGSGAGASQDSKNYGMAMAAMSQYAQSVGMTTSSSGMITAMRDDASDGVMDGMMGSTPVSMAGMGGMMGGSMQPTAGRSGMATAMATFIGSSMNKSGVTISDMQALMTQLSGSNGQLPGAGGTTAPNGMMSGRAYMGAMMTGTVTAFSVSNGTLGPQLATAPLDSAGNFSMSLGAWSGPVMLQVSGGSFHDLATGTTMAMQAGDVMTAVVPSLAAGVAMTGVHVTPLTSMAQARAQMMSGGMTAANITAANASVGSYFMVSDLLMDSPVDPAKSGSRSGATQTQMNYGMTVAAMSQYAQSLGMVSSSGMVTAMMKDASDGVMNGMMGSTSITMTGMSGGGMGGMGGGTMMQSTAGSSGMANAMSTFLGSTMNMSGVTSADVQALMTKLGSSNGLMP